MVDVCAVLDTVGLLAYLGGAHRKLGKTAKRMLDRAKTRRAKLAVPTLCLFEIGQLEEGGRISLSLPFERWCDLVEHNESLLVIPLQRAHVSEARALPALRDPFDRLIAGVAIALGVPLISPDARIAQSGRLTVTW